MTGNFAVKYICAWALKFVHSLNGEIFLFKTVKLNLTDSQSKISPQLLDQSKHMFLALSAKHISITSNQRQLKICIEKYRWISRCYFNFTAIAAGQPICSNKFFHRSFKLRLLVAKFGDDPLCSVFWWITFNSGKKCKS